MKVILCFLSALAVVNCNFSEERFNKNFWVLHHLELAKPVLNDLTTDRNHTANVNDIFDSITDDIGFYFADHDLDPLALPDIKEGFKAKPVLITYHGELELTNGILRDLSTVSRAGNATLHYYNKLLRISLGFKFDYLKLQYDYLAKIMNIGPKGKLLANIKHTEIFFDVIVDLHDFTVHLQNFEIPKIGKIQVHFRGNVLTDWLINSLSRITTAIFKGVIRTIVEKQIANVIQNAINEININGKCPTALFRIR